MQPTVAVAFARWASEIVPSLPECRRVDVDKRFAVVGRHIAVTDETAPVPSFAFVYCTGEEATGGNFSQYLTDFKECVYAATPQTVMLLDLRELRHVPALHLLWRQVRTLMDLRSVLAERVAWTVFMTSEDAITRALTWVLTLVPPQRPYYVVQA